MHTRISDMWTALISGFAGLIVVLISRLLLAVALFFAAIGGALLMAVAGTAQIAQLRRIMRRHRRKLSDPRRASRTHAPTSSMAPPIASQESRNTALGQPNRAAR